MKTLLLVRHAKSDWPEDTEDFDRPLAENGISDAKRMAEHLHKSGVKVDRLISSPALRALSTCKIFNQRYQTDMETNKKLYNANEGNFLSAIYELSDDTESVAMFSHNNGISNFANTLCDSIFAFSTCGVAAWEIDCNSWTDFEGAGKKLLFYLEPKNI